MDNSIQIVSACSLTQWFPKLKGKEIIRDNFLDIISSTFRAGNHIIVLEGDQGSGKTILLSQFVQQYSNDSIVLFVGNKCAWDYDPSNILFDLCRQIHFYLKREVIETAEIMDFMAARQYFRNLIYHLNLYRKIIYLVIDGLDQVPYEAQGSLDIILENIPFTNENICILLSCRSKSSALVQKVENISSVTNIKLVDFSSLEAREYFRDIPSVNDKDVDYIYQSCKNPRSLAVIKDKLFSCSNIDECLVAVTKDLMSYLEDEWNSVNPKEFERDTIAVLSFDPATRSTEAIAQILHCDEESLISIISNSKYLVIDERTKDVWFCSEIYRELFVNILKNDADSIKNKILDYYISIGDFSTSRVPSLLMSSGKAEDILSYMSYTNMERILTESSSYSTLINNIDYALKASLNCKKDMEKIKFTVAKNVVIDAGESSSLLAEVDALFSLGKIEEAIELGQQSYTNEDRMLLLSRIARRETDSKIAISPGLIEQIEELHARIDYKIIKDKSIEIASEIIHFKPDLAIDIIERASGENTELENELDFAFARLSFERMAAKDLPGNEDIISNLQSRIVSKGVRHISKGLYVLLKDFSVNDLMIEIGKLDTISEKILLIRNWLRMNYKKDSSLEVINYTIELINSSTEYKVSSDLLTALVMPLPFVKDRCEVERLITWLNKQDEMIRKSSSFEDYVKIQIDICSAQSKHMMIELSDRLVNLYCYINQIEDIVIRTECLSVLISKYDEINVNEYIEKKENIYKIIIDELTENMNYIASWTADHLKSYKNIVTNLSKKHFEMAKLAIMHINIQHRRNLCYHYALNSYIDSEKKEILDVKIVAYYLNSIDDDELRGFTIYHICESLSKESNANLPKEVFGVINSYLQSINDASLKVSIIASLLLLNDNPTCEDKLWTLLKVTWEEIDLHTDKIESGFSVVSKLALKCKDICIEFYSMIKEFEACIIFKNTNIFTNYVLYLQNAIRAFSGLITKEIYKLEDLEAVESLVDEIPSLCIRVKLLNDLSLRFYSNNQNEKGDLIVKNKIIPLLSEIPASEKNAKDRAMTEVIVSLYKNDSVFALHELSKLSESRRDDAIINIYNYIMYKVMPEDPIDKVNKYYGKITYPDYISIFKLIEETSVDYICYMLLEETIDSIYSNKIGLNKTQKTELTIKISNIIKEKFPNPKCIKHDGFKIISNAQLSKIDNKIKLEDLYNEAENKIDNKADLVYIYAILSELTTDNSFRKTVLEKAEKQIEKIPSLYERLEHLELLGFHQWYKDRASSKRFFSNAISSCKRTSQNDCISTQKSIIEVVNRLDTDFARSLLDIIDDDSSRSEARKSAIIQKQQLDLKEALKNGRTIKQDLLHDNESKLFVNSTWKLLGVMNAGGTSPITYQSMQQYFEHVKNINSYDLYPVLAWMIENLVRLYSSTDSANTFIRPFFDNLMFGLRFMLRILKQKSNLQKKDYSVKSYEDDKGILLLPHEREKGIKFVYSQLMKYNIDKVIICDRYFDPSCLDLIKSILTINSKCHFCILTSQEEQNKYQDNGIVETYKSYWRKNIAEDDFPCMDIVIVMIDKLFPSHDRYLLTDDVVIKFGTSINSMGGETISDINILEGQLAEATKYAMNKYSSRERIVANRNVQYILHSF